MCTMFENCFPFQQYEQHRILWGGRYQLHQIETNNKVLACYFMMIVPQLAKLFEIFGLCNILVATSYPINMCENISYQCFYSD